MWASSLQLSADRSQTIGLVIKPFYTVADLVSWPSVIRALLYFIELYILPCSFL